jgi:hypothetical protein
MPERLRKGGEHWVGAAGVNGGCLLAGTGDQLGDQAAPALAAVVGGLDHPDRIIAPPEALRWVETARGGGATQHGHISAPTLAQLAHQERKGGAAEASADDHGASGDGIEVEPVAERTERLERVTGAKRHQETGARADRL